MGILDGVKGILKDLGDIYKPVFVENNPILAPWAESQKKAKEKAEAKAAEKAEQKFKEAQIEHQQKVEALLEQILNK